MKSKKNYDIDPINELYNLFNLKEEDHPEDFSETAYNLIKYLVYFDSELIMKIIKMDKKYGIFYNEKKQQIYYNLFKNLTDDDKERILKKHSDFLLPLFKYIPDPSDQLKSLAIKKRCWDIAYIRNPTEAMQITAIKQNPFSIAYITHPTEIVQDMCLNALEKDFWIKLFNISDLILKKPNFSNQSLHRLLKLARNPKDIECIKNHENYSGDAELILSKIAS